MTYQELVSYYGTPAEVARKLQVTPQAVCSWRQEIPYVRQCHIEVITNRKLKAERTESHADA